MNYSKQRIKDDDASQYDCSTSTAQYTLQARYPTCNDGAVYHTNK